MHIDIALSIDREVTTTLHQMVVQWGLIPFFLARDSLENDPVNWVFILDLSCCLEHLSYAVAFHVKEFLYVGHIC